MAKGHFGVAAIAKMFAGLNKSERMAVIAVADVLSPAKKQYKKKATKKGAAPAKRSYKKSKKSEAAAEAA